MAFVSAELLLINYFSQMEVNQWAEMPEFIAYGRRIYLKFREKYPTEHLYFDLYDIAIRRAVRRHPEYFELVRVFRDRIFLRKKIINRFYI